MTKHMHAAGLKGLAFFRCVPSVASVGWVTERWAGMVLGWRVSRCTVMGLPWKHHWNLNGHCEVLVCTIGELTW